MSLPVKQRRKDRRRLRLWLKQLRIQFPSIPIPPEQLIKDAQHARQIHHSKPSKG